MAKFLFLGDIVGRAGRDAVTKLLPGLRKQYNWDLVIVNGENAAAGHGITAEIARDLKRAGVDGITLGDHTWDQRGFDQDISKLDFLCRPANLPPQCPGRTELILEAANGFKLGVVTFLGQQFMKIQADSGFNQALPKVEELRKSCDAVFVEMHAETTSEKVAMGWYLEGVACAVVGTHTHVPTADLRILPRGTAYLTDAGMTGPYDSVIGRDIQPVIARFLDGMPRKFTVAIDGVRLCGVEVEVDPATGRAINAKQFQMEAPTPTLE